MIFQAFKKNGLFLSSVLKLLNRSVFVKDSFSSKILQPFFSDFSQIYLNHNYTRFCCYTFFESEREIVLSKLIFDVSQITFL